MKFRYHFEQVGWAGCRNLVHTLTHNSGALESKCVGDGTILEFAWRSECELNASKGICIRNGLELEF